MVREHRLLTVKDGVNRIQFSWANTLIDPTSIEFRILDHQDKVDLVDTTFPARRSDALQWNIQSRMAGKIAVEIRYFTSGITWSADYVGIANRDETKLNLTGYVRVTNNSGELYDNAQTRMVVGTINLVEKIADLARGRRRGRRAVLTAPAACEKPCCCKADLQERPWSRRRRTTRRAATGRNAAEAGHQAGTLRILPLHDRRPRGHQRQRAQTAGGPQSGRRAVGVLLQALRPRWRSGLQQVLPFQESQAAG